MNTLLHFETFVNEISSSNSRTFKESVLKKYENDEIIRNYLKIAFDPYKVFGISTKKLNKKCLSSNMTFDCLNDPISIFGLFDYLEKHNTGTDSDIITCQVYLDHVASVSSKTAELLTSLICKNLSIGIDAKTINKVISGLIPTFDVQLANTYFDKPACVEGKQFALSTKIDGGRIIAIKENDQVSFFTRAGQKYEGLIDLEEEMAALMPNDTCLDGEITLLDRGNLSSKDAYKETMKIVRTKDKAKHGIKMKVFDWLPASDFKRQSCDIPYYKRRETLDNLFKNSCYEYFELLPLLYVGTDTSKITEILEEQIAQQEEGIMINIWDTPYEFKRTNNLLKVKKMQTMDLEIVDFEEGTGKNVGKLGAVVVRYKGGNTVKVGSGFTDELRDEIWNNKDEYRGTIIEIQYFEETTNAKDGCGLRFPIFKDFRPDKTVADY